MGVVVRRVVMLSIAKRLIVVILRGIILGAIIFFVGLNAMCR